MVLSILDYVEVTSSARSQSFSSFTKIPFLILFWKFFIFLNITCHLFESIGFSPMISYNLVEFY